jgi:uncharacterized protein YndB with AHSA1/START domain
MPTLRITRQMPAPREAVFALWLEADSLKSWMCAGSSRVAFIEVNPVVGGQFRIDMASPDGQTLIHTGEYLVIQPPEKLVFTWHSPAVEDRTTKVTIELRDDGDLCELTLVHEALPDEENVQMHHYGWNDILSKLSARILGELL